MHRWHRKISFWFRSNAAAYIQVLHQFKLGFSLDSGERDEIDIKKCVHFCRNQVTVRTTPLNVYGITHQNNYVYNNELFSKLIRYSTD